MSWSQTALDNTQADAAALARCTRFRALKRLLPRGLFGRSLIIIVAPMLILQAIVTSVFFDRHYRIDTATMTRGVATDVGYMVMLENSAAAGPGARRASARPRRSCSAIRREFTAGRSASPRTVSDARHRARPALADIFSSQIAASRQFRHPALPRLCRYARAGEGRRAAPAGAARARHRLERRHLHPLDDRLVAGADRHRDPVPAQPGEADRAAGLRRGKLRQGPQRARLQALWRHRSAPRRPRLHHHARAHRALRAAAHRHAGRRQPRSEDAADAHEAAARDDAAATPTPTRCTATSPRWSICSTNIWTSRAAKAARRPSPPILCALAAEAVADAGARA